MNRSRLGRLEVVITLVLLLTILAGCQAPATPQPTAEVPPPAEEESPTELPATLQPTSEVALPVEEETTVVIAVAQEPTGFNGLVTDTGYEQLVGELVYLAVTEIDPNGNIFAELAAEIPTIENGGVVLDEENWTMDVTWKLREDVYWADGEQVNTDDVVFTWNAITDPEKGIWVDGVDYTDSVEKIDDFTFLVRYNTVYPAYRTQFGGENFAVYPEHYCDPEQGFTEWDCNREPLSDGPYVLKEWETNDYLLFERNENYYEAGKPSIDRVIVNVVPEQSVRKSMTLEGDADVNMWLSEVDMSDLENQPNVYVSYAPTQRWVMRLIPNFAARGTIDSAETPHPIFSDKSVRQAIRMAIDVDTITEEIFLGYAKPVWTEFFRPPYNVCDIPKPNYDPEQAKALLEDAGWVDTNNDGVRECRGCATAEEGYPLSFELMTYAEYGEELELAQQLISEMLNNIGFDPQLSVVEGAVLWADYESGGIEQNGDFDLNLYDDGYPGTDPTDNMLWYYYHTDAGEPDYGWNVGRWSNEDFDALLDEAYTLDEDYRKEVFCQIAELLDEELPQTLLWSVLEANAFASRIQGAQSSVNDTLTWNVADWTLSE